MATKASLETPAHAGRPMEERRSAERAPSALREDEPVLARVFGVFGLALVALGTFVLVLAAYVLTHAPRQALQPGLVMVQSGGERRGPGATGAPAVDAQQIDQRLTAAAATTGGEVEVSLAWNSLSDLDLEVRDPAGELITAHHPQSASGWIQDVDANPTLLTEAGSQQVDAGQYPGPGDVLPVPDVLVDLDEKLPQDLRGLATLPRSDGKAPSRFTRRPVEHIYFARAPKGTYTVYAHCYSWREPNAWA